VKREREPLETLQKKAVGGSAPQASSVTVRSPVPTKKLIVDVETGILEPRVSFSQDISMATNESQSVLYPPMPDFKAKQVLERIITPSNQVAVSISF